VDSTPAAITDRWYLLASRGVASPGNLLLLLATFVLFPIIGRVRMYGEQRLSPTPSVSQAARKHTDFFRSLTDQPREGESKSRSLETSERNVCDEPQTDDSLGRLLYQLFQRERSRKGSSERKRTMKVIAYDRMKPGVTYETIEPYLPEEVANVWRLWKAGIVRENYARADELGVVIVFEVESVEAAQRYTDDFPLTRAGFLEWFFIPVQVPLPILVLLNSKVDSNEPYDRTNVPAVTQGIQ